MILYSPVPVEQIVDGIEENVKPLQEMRINGLIMQVQPINEYEVQIVRLISPNPQDYLNPQYAPGQRIRLQPVII